MLRKRYLCRFKYSSLCEPGLLYDGKTGQHLNRHNSLEFVKAATRINYGNLSNIDNHVNVKQSRYRPGVTQRVPGS